MQTETNNAIYRNNMLETYNNDKLGLRELIFEMVQSTVCRIQFFTCNKATGQPLCELENNYPHHQYLTRSGQKIMKETLKPRYTTRFPLKVYKSNILSLRTTLDKGQPA